MDIIPSTCSNFLTKYNTFDNYLSIVDAYSTITKLYGMRNIITDEVMDKLDMFQERFEKVDEFCWWDMEIIQTETGKQFTFKEFQESLSVYGLRLPFAAQYHQEIYGQVEVIWQTLQTISRSIMVHIWVSD